MSKLMPEDTHTHTHRIGAEIYSRIIFWSGSLSQWLVYNCDIWGSGVANSPILVGRDAILSGEQFLVFQRIWVPSSSRSFRPSFANDHSAFEMYENTLSHPGRVEVWSNVSFLTPMCHRCSTAVVLVNAIMWMSLFRLTCLIWPQ